MCWIDYIIKNKTAFSFKLYRRKGNRERKCYRDLDKQLELQYREEKKQQKQPTLIKKKLIHTTDMNLQSNNNQIIRSVQFSSVSWEREIER